MSKLAILYTRYSSDAQTGNTSVERQQAMFNTFLESKEGQEYTSSDAFVYQDNGVSGFSGSHIQKGAFGKFLEDLDSGKFKDFPSPLLCIENVDRFGRQSAVEAISVMTSILKGGVDIYFMSSRQMLTQADISGGDDMKLIMFVLESSRAHRESARKSEMVSKAWSIAQEKVISEGRQITKRVPSWINPENKNEVIPERAAVIQRIFNMRLQGASCNKIAKALNTEGIPFYTHRTMKEGKEYKKTVREKWVAQAISAILDNRAVLGVLKAQTLTASNSVVNPVTGKREVKPGKQLRGEVEGYFPQIVNHATFAAIQLLKEEYKTDTVTGGKLPTGRKATSTIVNTIKLFRSMVKCSECGGNLSVYGARERYAGVYKCCNTKAGACDTESISRKDVDTALLSRLLPSLNKLNVNDTLEQQLAEKENERANVVKGLATASDLVSRLEGIAQEMQIERLNTLSKQHADLNTQIEALKTKRQATDFESVEHLDLNTFEGRFEAQIIIKKIFKRITVNVDKRTMNVLLVNGNEYIDFEIDGKRNLQSHVDNSDQRNAELNMLTGMKGGVSVSAGEPIPQEAPDFTGWPVSDE